MYDHKKIRTERTQTDFTWATHTHRPTYTEKEKLTTHVHTFPTEVRRMETPTRFSCEKKKSCHWPLSNVDPKLSVWGQLGQPPPLNPHPALPTCLAICYLCNVYVWMLNLCKYPAHIQPIYMRIYRLHICLFDSAQFMQQPSFPCPSNQTYIGNSTLSNL